MWNIEPRLCRGVCPPRAGRQRRDVASYACTESFMATDLQIAVRKISSVNPSTGVVLRELECASESEVRLAVTRARAAQAAWAEVGVRKRIAVLRQLQRSLQEKKSEMAEGITREAGKPVAEALTTEV